MRLSVMWSMLAAAAALGADNDAPARIGDAWSDKRNPIVGLFKGQRLDLWSLKPVAAVTPPNVENPAWLRNPIDAFILAALEAEDTKPSQPADPRTLVRRLSFDMVGLPPAPEAVEAFVADGAPDAYERLVDRLLATPQFGERQAQWWLDAVRYSDSNGFDWDEFRPKAFLFRDYVVRSLNADKPFDHFVREQLAGDELLAGPPRNAAERDLLIATGFLRMGPQDNSAGGFDETARARSDMLFDLVETTGSAFLGMTMSCCRCHDHKQDPLSQADHYRLRAFFAGVKYGDDVPIDFADEQERIRKQNAEIDAKLKALDKERRALRKPIQEKETDKKKAAKLPDTEVVKKLPADAKAKFEKLIAEIDALKKAKRPFAHALSMTDAPDAPPATYVLAAGDHKSPRAAVAPGFLSALDPNPAAITKPANPKTSGRRLALANWIVSPNNPLTARVVVNRIWQNYFGKGLVATPGDFGFSGDRPTHPELLDWLAARLVAENWSLKAIHRLVATSAAYRQGSPTQAPPGESGYGRHSIRRLTAEQLRDAMLTTAGVRSGRMFGAPVWPELPADVLQANPAFLDDNAEKTKGWYPSPAADLNVRSLYLIQKRTVRIPFMEAFDLPENAVSCSQRNCAIVAPQALALLNGSQTVALSKAFATRVAGVAGADRDRQVSAAFRFALQRLPTAEELADCRALLAKRPLAELCRALLNLNEFVFVD